MPDSFAYDLLEYPPHLQQQMLPALLAPIARVHGIRAASPRNCRLLEVGCGDGLQLLTLAMAYPESSFVGVDLSSAAVARGEAIRCRLGLGNLELVAADLTDWDPGDASFDYVLAHGFFSWVPEHVRTRLLQLCRRHLAPEGIAYISYNALPGCHLRRMVWEMMRHHVRAIEAPMERIAEARRFLEWLAKDVLGEGSYAVAVRSEAHDLLQRTHPSVLFHDDLAAINHPYSVTGFVELATQHGLQFLAEADYCEMSDAVAPAEAVARLDALSAGEVVAKEQYLDFLKGRRFRQTVLCRSEAPLQRTIDSEALASMAVVGDLRAQQPADPATGATTRFTSPAGAAVTTDHPFVKEALGKIGDAFPTPILVQDLLDQRQAEGERAGVDDDRSALIEALTRAFRHGLVTLVCDPPGYAPIASAKPVASPLARLQLEASAPTITSLRPAMVAIGSPVTRELLRLMDGSRDRAALLQDLSERMTEVPPPEGEPAQDAAWWRGKLEPQFEEGMQQIARMALLVAE